MRKLLMTFAVLLSSASIFAQETSSLARLGLARPAFDHQAETTSHRERPRTEEYCEFTLAGAFGQPGKCSVRLDLGQFHGGWPGLVDKLRDEAGDLLLFNSAVDALNYLNGYGWQLFSVYNDSSDTHYVMRRKVLTERSDFQ